ncbi:MAG: PKD domain-containing protein [Bacteroidales bacterium]
MMRITTYILLFCSLLMVQQTSAQSRKAGPINSGFVFIDGKYIEPPYTIKRQGLTVKVNGKQILKMSKPKSPYNFKKRPKMPIEAINKNSGLDEIYKPEHPVYDKRFIYIIESYFLEKYRYEIACDSIKNFYMALPNVKSIENYKNCKDIFEITAFNGDTRKYSLSIHGKRYNQNYGPESKKHYSRKKLKSNAEGEIQAIKNKLEQNKMMFFFMDKEINNRVNSYSINEKNSHRVYDILQSDYGKNQKADSLNNIFINKEFLKRIIKEYQKTEKIKNRLENDNNNKRKNDDDTGLMPDNKEKSHKSQFYSPQNTEIMAWCPCTWEPAFQYFSTNELPNVVSYVENQGYNYNPSNVFTDEIPNDNDFGTCTYSNFISLRNAGLLYMASHGNQNGMVLIIASTEDGVYNWSQGNPDIVAVQETNTEPNNPWVGDMWLAVANSSWVTQNWSSDLQQNKTLSVLSCCYSNANGWVDACPGGICFGYNEQTHWGWLFDQGINYNNRNLFKRMNGEKDNASKREASDAYWAMPDHKDGFTYNSNTSITLCPSISEKYPAENVTVPSTVQSGHIKFDTWCDAGQTADNALDFDVQNGDIIVYEKSWEGSDDYSNQINFQWSGTDGEITVTVNPEYIRAYNGGQRLDYDGVTPNAVQGSYTFTVDDDIPTEAPDADFTWDTDNYTVDFADLSQNNPTSWDWDFGDGSTSTNQDPTHVYSGNGNYTVTLTVQNQYGSDEESKTISINSDANSFEISGKVYDSDDNTVITNATVAEVDNADNAVSTNSDGEYSFYVDPGWNGSLKASAPGYESKTQPFNAVYVDKEHDFNLSEKEEVYFIYDEINPCEQNCFHAENIPISGVCYWEINGNIEGQGNQYCSYFNSGTYTIKLIVKIEESIYDIYVEDFEIGMCDFLLVPQIEQFCTVINIGKNLCFQEMSIINEDAMNSTQRNWCFEYNQSSGNCIEETEILTFDEKPFPDNKCHTFNNFGKQQVKLQYYSFDSVLVWDNDVGLFGWWVQYPEKIDEVWAGVIVIDCDLTSTYLPFPTGFTNAVRSDWAYENWGGPVYIYGGTFEFNGLANNYLSQKPTTISACNEIVIDGDVEFVASGDNELVLEINDDPCLQGGSKSAPIYPDNDKPEDDYKESKWHCYPNPVRDKLNVSVLLENKQDLHFSILNAQGQVIAYHNRKNIFPGKYLFRFDVSKYQPGLYFISVILDSERKATRIIIQ